MKKRPAFSIVEMMITLTIFSIVSAIAMSVLYNANRSAKAVQTQVFLYTESQAIMDQVARVIERNTIDYETYYLIEVQGQPGWGNNDYGYYGQAFINPGSGGPDSDGPYSTITGYGTYCAGTTDTFPDSGCSLPDYTSGDLDTGQLPFGPAVGSPENYNAFCEDSTDCGEFEHHVADYLALINTDGDERILFGKEAFDTGSSDHYISKVEMIGSDTDGDGIEDSWECNSRYTCNGTDAPHHQDLDQETSFEASNGQEDFMPISPSSLSISELYFILTPIEDPYRAFAETDVQSQAQVTIVMTVTLSDEFGASVIGDIPEITIQRTVSSGVYSEVVSYE